MPRIKFHPFLHASELLTKRLEIELSPLGVRPRQARVLSALGRMGEVSQAALAREYDATEASMSTMIARLIEAGYITRSIDPQNRSGYLVKLSPDGETVVEKIRSVWESVDHIVEEKIGTDQQRALREISVQLRDGLGGRVAGIRNDKSRALRSQDRQIKSEQTVDESDHD
ncbi:MAG: MarR family winged helix-turn-helix transcriptional regulator [Pseudomonadota bacterium]